MRLLETTFANPGTVDTDAGVIRGVKFLGRMSRNGREYSDRAMRQAATMYEDRDITLDHDRKDPNRERQVLESVGKPVNLVVKPDGIYGDFAYWKSHPAASLIVERATRSPGNFGFSHNADGKQVTRGGRRVVESINRVVSLDLVLRPATTNGLFESEESMPTIRQILESCAPARLQGKSVKKFLEMEGMADAPVPEASEASSMSADQKIRAAFKEALQMVLDDDSLDMKATLSKVKDILTAREKLLNGGAPEAAEASETPDASDDEDEESPAVESTRLKRLESQMAKLLEATTLQKNTGDARLLIESFGLQPTESLVSAVLGEKDQAGRVRVIEAERRVNSGPFRPRSLEKPNAKFTESDERTTNYADSKAAVTAWSRG